MTGEKKPPMTGEVRAVERLSWRLRQHSGGDTTGEKMPEISRAMMDLIADIYGKVEGAVREDYPALHTHWQIACILRSAAGLPYSDTPASGWREDGTPEIFSIAHSVVSVASGSEWDDPKSVSMELIKLRYSLRDLKRQLLSIDEQAATIINLVADPIMEQQCDKLSDEFTLEEYYCQTSEVWGKRHSTHYRMPIEATIDQMEQLEKGLTQALEEVEDEVRDRNDMGQSRTYAAKRVALGVAQYMYEVSGKIPGLWTGESPSGPYAKAVLEIFDIFDIPHGSLQRAGEWATAKLKSYPKF